MTLYFKLVRRSQSTFLELLNVRFFVFLFCQIANALINQTRLNRRSTRRIDDNCYRRCFFVVKRPFENSGTWCDIQCRAKLWSAGHDGTRQFDHRNGDIGFAEFRGHEFVENGFEFDSGVVLTTKSLTSPPYPNGQIEIRKININICFLMKILDNTILWVCLVSRLTKWPKASIISPSPFFRR